MSFSFFFFYSKGRERYTLRLYNSLFPHSNYYFFFNGTKITIKCRVMQQILLQRIQKMMCHHQLSITIIQKTDI